MKPFSYYEQIIRMKHKADKPALREVEGYAISYTQYELIYSSGFTFLPQAQKLLNVILNSLIH